MRFKYDDNLDEDYLVEMSNVRGFKAVHPHSLPFSFYFSSGSDSKHSIRVKPSFNPEKLIRSKVGNLELSGNWTFTPGPDDKNISAKSIDEMKKFFKDNIVIFALTWDEFIDDPSVADYFEGDLDINDLVKEFTFYDKFKGELDNCHTIKDIEYFVRENMNKLHELGYNVNLYGN